MRFIPFNPVLCLALTILCAQSTATAQPFPSTALTPWPGNEVPVGSITSITEQEIVVRPNDPADPVRQYGWHEIQSIDAQLNEYADSLQIGRQIWRSMLRLDRQDWTSAESLLEPLAAQMEKETGPTATAFYRALMRARLARLDRPHAAQAWLSWRHASNDPIPPNPELAPYYAIGTQPFVMLDQSTDLFAKIHTIAIEWASGTEPDRVGLSKAVDALYDNSDSIDPDARLQVLCLAAYAGSPEIRAEARQELDALSKVPEGYESTWARFAIGRSLTLESSASRVRLGIAQLLGISIYDDRTAPILAGLALAEAASVANRIKDPRAARILSAEFRLRFPGHPAEKYLPEIIVQTTSTFETTP